MPEILDFLLVGGTLFGAAFYLVVTWVRKRKTPGCPACPGCGSVDRRKGVAASLSRNEKS